MDSARMKSVFIEVLLQPCLQACTVQVLLHPYSITLWCLSCICLFLLFHAFWTQSFILALFQGVGLLAQLKNSALISFADTMERSLPIKSVCCDCLETVPPHYVRLVRYPFHLTLLNLQSRRLLSQQIKLCHICLDGRFDQWCNLHSDHIADKLPFEAWIFSMF